MRIMKKNKLDPLKTSSYDYNLPKELIATQPVSPADKARLLVMIEKMIKLHIQLLKNFLILFQMMFLSF